MELSSQMVLFARVVDEDEGQQFYERCSEIAQNVIHAEEMIVSLGDKPQGRMHILSTVAFGKAQLMPVLPAFLEKYPEVHLSVDFTDTKRDFADDRIDLAIQFTEQIEDQSLVARKLAPNRRVVCASPEYLERMGTPQTFEDMADHNYLRLSTVKRWNDWHIDGAEPTSAPARLPSNMELNSADAVYHAALAGIGIARLSTYLIAPDLASGRLVRLFPEYEGTGSDIYAVYSTRRNLSPKVRALIDHLVAEFSPVPPWERQVT